METHPLSERLRSLLRNYPVLPPLLGVLGVILPVLTGYGWTLSFVFVAVILSLFPWMAMRNRIATVVCILLSGTVLHLSDTVPETHYMHQLSAPRTGVVAELRITETLLPADNPYLPLKSLIAAELFSIRFSADGEPIPVTGSVMLRINRDLADSVRPQLTYGKTFTATGILEQPDPPLFADGFDFGRWLVREGAPMVLEIQDLEGLTDAPSMSLPQKGLCLVMTLRDGMLSRLSEGLDPLDQRMSAALLFGCRQGLDNHSIRDFIRTGTIHIFAVSGMHVAMLSLLLLLLLKAVPDPWRYWALTVLLFFYVLSTGLQPSAFRAWLMISVFAIVHGLHLRSNPLNTLGLAMLVLLLIHPGWFFDMGFQYSFAVTFFLLLSWRPYQAWRAAAIEKDEWIPLRWRERKATWRRQFSGKIFGDIASCLTALCASAPLMSFYNGFYMPLSMFLNFAVIPSVGIVAGAFLVKLLLPLTWIDLLPNTAISLGFGWMTGLCSAAAKLDAGWLIPGAVPVWMVLAIWVMLAVALLASRTRISIVGFALLVLSTVFVPPIQSRMSGDTETFLIHGGRIETPVVLRVDRDHHRVTLVNTGPPGGLNGLPTMLRKAGFASLNTVVLTAANAGVYGGLESLLKEMPVETLVIPIRIAFNSKLPETLRVARLQNVRICYLQTNDSVKVYNDPFFELSVMPDALSFHSSGSPLTVPLKPASHPSRPEIRIFH